MFATWARCHKSPHEPLSHSWTFQTIFLRCIACNLVLCGILGLVGMVRWKMWVRPTKINMRLTHLNMEPMRLNPPCQKHIRTCRHAHGIPLNSTNLSLCVCSNGFVVARKLRFYGQSEFVAAEVESKNACRRCSVIIFYLNTGNQAMLVLGRIAYM